MYYFFSIVKKRDLKRGNIVPGYTLYRKRRLSSQRSGFMVSDKPLTLNKVLVTSLTGNQVFIRFMSNFRTSRRVKRWKKRNVYEKFRPEGALFLFECNRSGKRTGTALFIKTVPDKSITEQDAGLAVMKRQAERRYSLCFSYSQEEKYEDLPSSNVKPKLPQILVPHIEQYRQGIQIQKAQAQAWRRFE